MARKHTKYKITYEMLEKLFELDGPIFQVDCDVDRGLAVIHTHGEKVPEGAYAIERLLQLKQKYKPKPL